PSGDALLDRQARLMRDSFQSQQMSPDMIKQIVALETDITAEFNGFRAELNGQSMTDNQLKKILKESNDEVERRAAWEASKQIGAQVVDRVRQTVQLRNRAAREMGFANYYAMSLHLQELNEDTLFALFDRLEKLTRPLFTAYKTDLDRQLADRFHLLIDQLRPWHYADPFFQETPAMPGLNLDQYYADKDIVALAQQFYQKIGMPVDDILGRSDLYEREGKYQHAYCIDIDRQGDVRTMDNVQPNARWMGTLLHELGHAVYDKYHDRSLPFLVREPAHTLSTEAIAMLMGRFSENGAWLRHYLGLSPSETVKFETKLKAFQSAGLLIFTRWDLTVCHFEREMYRNPDQDLNKLWWDLVEKFQMLKRPEGRNQPDWASKIHIACYPAYYQNYMLGEMTASQLLEFINTEVLGGHAEKFVESPEVGKYLVNKYFKLGSRFDWNGLLKESTGEELRPEYFAKHLQ
ncbi:MAG TPA: M2 family metallopeptidase, partial [Anaerolineae bacterium]|nr:M2 family metallopeptidase [Anaerolineae bacterium]